MVLVKGVNFYGPRSDYVVSGSDCGYMFIWDKKTEAIIQRKRADRNGTVSLIFTFKIIFLIMFFVFRLMYWKHIHICQP